MTLSLQTLIQTLRFFTDCLQCLSFPEMYEREHDVTNATNDTCTWLFQHPVYLEWCNQQHGLLWIKGHPGVGKSTLMKHIIRTARKDKSAISASYFFHGRGSLNQQNISGLFRSLLHQIMTQNPDLCNKITFIFNKKIIAQGEYKKHWEWNQNELRDLFVTHVVETAKKYQVRLYIDALDECGEDVAVDLVKTFRGLADSLCICFSCRHYPLIALENGLEISVEKNNAQDIETYLRHQSVGHQFREQIIEKASGNFQWSKLVIEQVSQWLRRGKPSRAISNMISSLPAELSRLYEGFLANIEESDKPQSLKLFQWMCFAMRPLSLSELRFAMAVDEDTSYLSILECQESDLYVDTDEAMKKRVCDLSHGLAESTEYGGNWIVQLIHQSVDDFLREKGLQILHQSQHRALNGTLLGCSHFRLSRSCLRYLSMSELQEFYFKVDRHNTTSNYYHLKKRRIPFLEYATLFWNHHAKIVETEKVSQADLISYFHLLKSQSPSGLFISWLKIHNSLRRSYLLLDIYSVGSSHLMLDIYSAGSTLVHFAAQEGFLSVLDAAFHQDIEMDPINQNGRTPLSLAARNGHEAVVKFLLERGSVATNSEDSHGQTPLIWAAKNGHETVVKLLLERDDVAVNSRDLDFRTPLSWAAEEGHEAIVKLLLERGDVATNSRDS